jgi:putative transposase
MTRKRHSEREVAEKLQQASSLAAQGKTQPEIAKVLGISVMTYHRWRKEQSGIVTTTRSEASPKPAAENGAREQMLRIADLQIENSRLRRLVTDLLLEKVRLEEVLDRAAPMRAAG